MVAPTQQPAPLLARVASGDPAAFAAMIEAYGGLIWAISRRFEREDAEDAVQEIFLDLWKSAGRFDVAIASEPTFVAMIARRRLIDRRRRQERRPVGEDHALDQAPAAGLSEGPADPYIGVEAALAARALDRLGTEQREVVVLTTCHGLSHAEVASRLRMPLGTVKAHARRGLIALRAALAEPREPTS
jgi:RNA polymerase sigma factor (sigma-70 family)